MFKVKLIKGLSYTGVVRVTKHDPYAEVESKEAADALVASGYFELVEAEPAAETAGGAESKEAADALVASGYFELVEAEPAAETAGGAESNETAAPKAEGVAPEAPKAEAPKKSKKSKKAEAEAKADEAAPAAETEADYGEGE